MAWQSDARLAITDGTTRIDLLDPKLGWLLEDPGWTPQISGFKGGGVFVDPALAEGRTLVHAEYGTVAESIPLSAQGIDQAKAIATVRDLLKLLRQASDYWRYPYTLDPVWIEARPAGEDCQTGYSLIMTGRVESLSDPYRQPFYSARAVAQVDNLALIIEREPFWRSVPPGTVLGPFFNLLNNPDFELWTKEQGARVNVEPSAWTNSQTTGAIGSNNQDTDDPHSGRACLKVSVTSMDGVGRKGVYQVVDGIQDETEYTLVAWIKNDSVQYGTGRLLITYGTHQLEVYNRPDKHGWKLYTATFTTAIDDAVVVYCEIVGTGAADAIYTGAQGDVYFDSLMLLEGDWVDEAEADLIPYLASSHVVNHTDKKYAADIDDGDIDYLDVWNVPGDVDAPVRLTVENDTTPADWNNVQEVISKVRVGIRRAGDVLDFDHYVDIPGEAATGTSSDDLARFSLGSQWTEIATHTVSGQDLVRSNSGKFRLFARVRDMVAAGGPTTELRLTYWVGAARINTVEVRAVPVPVARSFCMVDVTEYGALAWGDKYWGDQATSVGYKIEARRSVGTANFDVDYILRMPTDSGFISADVDPPIIPENSLMADATGLTPTVQAYIRHAGMLRTVWKDNAVEEGVTESKILAAKVHEGELFVAGMWDPIAATGTTRKWNGKRWVTYISSFQIMSLEEYAGVLYGGDGSGKIWRWTGSAWSLAHYPGYDDDIVDMCVYAGKLYIMDDEGRVHTYDGSTWDDDATNIPDFSGTDHNYAHMAVYNGKLYITQGLCGPRIYVWDGTALSLVGNVTGMSHAYALADFNGWLWIGGVGTSPIGYYDGSAFHADTGFSTDLANVEAIYAFKVYDDRLYAASLYGSTSYNGRVSWTYREILEGYERWNKSYNSRRTYSHATVCLEVFNGEIYGGTQGSPIASVDASLLVLSSRDTWYKVTDYRGTLFWAPNRETGDLKRHRYVFSWDRENYVNAIDDRLLVGVSVVPRYFSLLGKG